MNFLQPTQQNSPHVLTQIWLQVEVVDGKGGSLAKREDKGLDVGSVAFCFRLIDGGDFERETRRDMKGGDVGGNVLVVEGLARSSDPKLIFQFHSN